METSPKFRMYRKYKDDGTPWKDWLISDETVSPVEIWAGDAGSPLRSALPATSVGRENLIQFKQANDFHYLGLATIEDGQARLVEPETASTGPQEDASPLVSDIRLFWELKGDAGAVVDRLCEVAIELSQQTDWIKAFIQHSATYVTLQPSAGKAWEFNVTPDGRHNQGMLPADCGPAPVLILFKLAREGLVVLAGDNGQEIEPVRFSAELSHLAFADVPYDALIEVAGKIGLVLQSISVMPIKRKDAWL